MGLNFYFFSGSMMVLVMKLISLAFDLDKGVISRPNILEYFGYSVSVSSVIFGPFMTYTDYCQILVGKRMVSNLRFFSAKFILELVYVWVIINDYYKRYFLCSLSEFLVVSWSDQELFSVALLLDHISLYSTMDI